MVSKVVLIHGLGRTRRSMFRLERYLRKHGFETIRFGYRSRKESISQAAHNLADYLDSWYHEYPEEGKIHLVTHSLGSLLARYCEAHSLLPHVHRIVMLGPPNHGSEVADWFNKHFPRFFDCIMGPHGPRLGTDDKSYPSLLPGRIRHETGVIAGTKNYLFFTYWMLPRPNDGLVTVKSTRIKGMKDWVALKCGHTFIMNDPHVRKNIVYFLRSGSFPQKT